MVAHMRILTSAERVFVELSMCKNECLGHFWLEYAYKFHPSGTAFSPVNALARARRPDFRVSLVCET